MSDEIKVRREEIDLDNEPLKYCQSIYEESRKRQEDLNPINEDNRLFFEGMDPDLKKLGQDPKVTRSNQFFQEIAPAVETIVGHAVSALKEREVPLTAMPRKNNPAPEEKDQANWIAREIVQQMKEDEYLTDKFTEHVLASEIQRSPPALKVGWRRDNVREPELTIIERFRGLLLEERFRFRQRTVGRPYVEYLWPEEFLYEPFISDFYSDSHYVIHAQWRYYYEILALAKEQGYNVKKIKRFHDKVQKLVGDGKTEISGESQRDSLYRGRGTPIDKVFRDGKYLITENYILDYHDNGNEIIRLIVVIGNEEIVYTGRSKIHGIRWPFIVLTSTRLPGTLESLCSLDKTKAMGRFYNALSNAYIDALSYHMFAMWKKRKGNAIYGEPKVAPNAVWEMQDVDGIQPLLPAPLQIPDVLPYLQMISMKLWNVLNAQDLPQGQAGQQYEKATIAKIRTVGRARRLSPKHERYGKSVIRVAQAFMALNQQFSPNKQDFMLNVVFDVPSLTGITDPETERQENMLLLSQAQQSPLYQGPIGLKKLRNLHEQVLQSFKKLNIDDILPTWEEIQVMIGTDVAMQTAQLEKEQALEQVALQEGEEQNE